MIFSFEKTGIFNRRLFFEKNSPKGKNSTPK
jgi:hypothetical protein